jgi:dTDP-glucose 4,6-dehydratase
MKILVTGGAGFIGANFVHHWLNNHPGDSVTVLDALTYAGERSSLPDESACFRFVHGDICDTEAVATSAEGCSLIVHFAAESHVDRSIHGPEAFLQTNVFGTYRLLEYARKTQIRFHHISTDEVFGSLGSTDPAFREDTPYAPNSPYSATKAASDHLVRSYVHTYGLAATTSNCSNNYGPYHFPEKLIPLCITNALQGIALPVYGDGANIRDWLHVEDHCRGIELVITKGQIGETYNLGGRNEWKNIDLVRALTGLVDEEFSARPGLRESYPDCPCAHGASTADLITFVKDRPGHDRRYAVDISKAERELGYLPRYTFDGGLRQTVRWFIDNAGWWRPLLSRRG